MDQIQINSADLNILRELLQTETVERIERKTSKELVTLVPEIFFEKVPQWLFMSPENYIMQYKKWSESEKEQVELVLSFMRLNFFIKGGIISNNSKIGSYTDYWVSNGEVDFPFRIYAQKGFIDFITYYQLHYFKPDFTLAELYQEALSKKLI